jgi:adenylylsulfate kinase
VSWAIWITGPPGSGKSAIARAAEAELRAGGRPVKRLELDEIRETITPAPRYTDEERDVVYRALGYMAALLVESGTPVLIDATAHRRIWRDLVRDAIPCFAEVQLVCPLAICRERERARVTGHAPRNIYEKAGRPGATVPGVDIPYEAALAPELVIDTGAETVSAAATSVVRLARRLAVEAPATACSAGPGDPEPGWAIWITGRPGSGKSALALHVAESLRQRRARVRLLDLPPLQRFLFGDEPTGAVEHGMVHRVLAYAAKLLSEAGVSVIIDATAVRRAWRDVARTLIPGFAEVQLLCPSELCLERERAVRWGLTFDGSRRPLATAPPDIALDYEESIRPDLAIRTDADDVQTAAERVLRLIHRLAKSEATTRSRGK